jgi:hypothetical protein
MGVLEKLVLKKTKAQKVAKVVTPFRNSVTVFKPLDKTKISRFVANFELKHGTANSATIKKFAGVPLERLISDVSASASARKYEATKGRGTGYEYTTPEDIWWNKLLTHIHNPSLVSIAELFGSMAAKVVEIGNIDPMQAIHTLLQIAKTKGVDYEHKFTREELDKLINMRNEIALELKNKITPPTKEPGAVKPHPDSGKLFNTVTKQLEK